MRFIFSILVFCILLSTFKSFGHYQIPNCESESCLETLHFNSVRLNKNIPLKLEDAKLLSLLGET